VIPEWADTTFVVVGLIAAVVAYRNGAARAAADDRERGRRLGVILMVAATVVGSTAAGAVFAERSADDPAPRAAWLLLAVAGIVLTSGAALRMGARTPAPAVSSTVRGRALVRSVREAGPGMSGIPVWVLELDVSAPGIPEFRTELHAEVPRRMAETLQEGRYVPVVVDERRGRDVTLDWVRTPESVAGDDYRAPVPIAPVGPPLASRGSSSALGRFVKIALPFAIVVVLGTATNRLLESDEGAPATVAPAGIHTGATFGDAAAESPPGVEPAFSFTAPEGWRWFAGEDRSPVAAIAPDVVLGPVDGRAASAVVGRLRGVDASGRSLRTLLPMIERRLDASLVPSTIASVGGEPAVALDLLEGPAVDAPAVAVVREGRVVIVAAIGLPEGGSSLGATVEAIVETWSWE
jgi:hypothetical protein